MTVQVVARVRLNQDEIDRVLHSPGGPVFQGLQRGVGRGRDLAKLDLTINQLVDTGMLRNQIESSVTIRGQDLVGRVTSYATYTMFVHQGTRGPIVPRRARALRFTPKGSGTAIFRPRVRGTLETGRWSPFLTNSLEKLTIGDFL